jgi:BirA family biotin operon repressor/biotin-[acetyl-CoA-carboxylase] ligase
MDQHALDQVLADLPLGPMRYFQQIGSTNDEAYLWAKEGTPDLSVIVADEQTAGRGRGQRQWHTPAGGGLAFSVIIHPEGMDDYENIPRLAGLGALAVTQALKKKYNLPAQIKWPNDVLVNHRKLAGILGEAHWTGNRLSALILGIGVNVSPESVPQDVDYPATCVETVFGAHIDRLDLLHNILAELITWRSKLTSREIIKAWESELAFRDEWIQLVTEGEPMLVGLILGLQPDGSLKMRTPNNEVMIIRAGEIHLRPVDKLPK